MVSAEKELRRWPRRAALNGWVCDSGGFTHLTRHGKWMRTAEQHAELVQELADRCPGLEWAAPQDWMCEPFVLAKTGLSMLEHQERTVENFLQLRELAPDIPWIPVLQGYLVDDYYKCWDLYHRAGVDLVAQDLVGVGSVCRRQNSNEIELLFYNLWLNKFKTHGFGVKLRGLDDYKEYIETADSTAWASNAKWAKGPMCGSDSHKKCTQCFEFAHTWYETVRLRCGL